MNIPPPEMVFPSNILIATHEPSGFQYRFTAEEGLRCVDGISQDFKMSGVDLSHEWRSSTSHTGRRNIGEKPKRKNKAIKVAYAEEWGKSRNDPANSTSSASAPTADGSQNAAVQEEHSTAFGAAASAQIAEARDYDWTYSTTWAGTNSQEGASGSSAAKTNDVPHFAAASDPSTDRIPVERLGPSSGEPILFYDDLVLFEDELGDNGSSMLGVKVRVMPSGFLILQRFFLRVDDVVFRLFDTRMYCAFNEPIEEGATTGLSRPSASNAAAMSPAAAPWARPSAIPTATTTRATPLTADLASISLGQPRSQQTSDGSASTARPLQRLIREVSGCEAPYKDVKARLPPYRPNDLSLLTDPGWVSQTLQTITARRFAAAPQGASHPSMASLPAARTVLPATLPGAASGPDTGNNAQASVLGEIADEDVWEGVGQRVDVAVLQ